MHSLDRLLAGDEPAQHPLTSIRPFGDQREDDRDAEDEPRVANRLPDGVEALPIRGAGETMFWLSGQRALVPGDRILGAASGGLRLCPESWLGYLPSVRGVLPLKESIHRATGTELAKARGDRTSG